MSFDTDTVASGKLVDAFSRYHNRTGPFVSGGEQAIRDGERKLAIVDLEIGAAG